MFEVDDPGNQPLADAYEIVVGSSHTEPLMRAQNEFGHFYEGPWAYNLNNKTIDEYFRYGVQRAKPYARNSLWTMGMRGTGDTAIEGLGVDHIVEMLHILVKNQRQIISEGLNVTDITTVPQTWCLYKEVMTYLFAGLQVPDDVTLLWADDNWGNVRRLPLLNETQRHGGAGVYYHFDYVGDPRNYKWINTIQLTKTAEQMHMAYARGADRIWVVNVGDMKALEIPISHFFDMAYDAKRWHVDSTFEWAQAWATREFGADQAKDIADVMMKYGMYAARRKYELIEPWVYSVLNYNEADAVLQQWAALVAKAQAIYNKLPAEAQAAYFETVLHPAMAGEIVQKIQIGGARNMFYAGQRRNAANKVIQEVLALSAADANLTRRWDALLDGKWKHFMDRKSRLMFVPVVTPQLTSPRNPPRLRRLLAAADAQRPAGYAVRPDRVRRRGRRDRHRRRGLQRDRQGRRQVAQQQRQRPHAPAHRPLRPRHPLLRHLLARR
jgi:hypothetical protein